jgi:hypothetical protein
MLVSLALAFALRTSAEACEIVSIGGGRSHEALVRNARVIVRARAERAIPTPGPQGAFALSSQVQFRVLAVFKGTWESDTLQFNGSLFAPLADVPAVGYNFKPLPYPGCYSTTYLAGREYLLLLGADEGLFSRMGELTPYWAPQQPTNMQISGESDSWMVWVREQLKLRK